MNIEIVNKLWSRSGGWGCLSQKTAAENWIDEFFYKSIHPDIGQLPGTDMFFSPLTYETEARRATSHTPADILFADLDPVNPSDLDIKPHIAWETSPGSYQAVWLLAHPVKYKTEWAQMNRRMTYTTEADRGGWSGSKVLRVPGTINYKYPEEPQGKLLWELWDDRPYTLGELDHKLIPYNEIARALDEMAPEIIKDERVLDSIWSKLPPRVQYKLAVKKVNDRSRFIVSTAHIMREAGVEKEEAFQMLWYARFNKWRQRNNPDRLWTEICQVYSR